MRKVFILYNSFFDQNGLELTIGGVQTYIKMLITVIKKGNMTPVIIQTSRREFKNEYMGIDVFGVPVNDKSSKKKNARVLYNKTVRLYDEKKDIIIFATHSMNVKNNDKRIIGIHHGITSDIPVHSNFGSFLNIMYGMIRSLRAYDTIIGLKNFNYVVAVDHNVPNWYRTRLAHGEVPIRVIPNSTYVHDFAKTKNSIIKIIFARRFFEYRGTKLFSSAIYPLLKCYSNIEVTFAGSGPDENYLKEKFRNFSNVDFIKYESNESLKIHEQYQVAVVPTLGSEGTSLSLLEAMATKCAVIGTNVGGLTNIILDQFNGLIIDPNVEDLTKAIETLILNEKLRERISENGFLTVKQAFNIELWEKRWLQVFNDIIQK